MMDRSGYCACSFWVCGDFDAGREFLNHYHALDGSIQERITLENDDKTYTAIETLLLCEELKIPMVLDIHHHQINNSGERITDFWQRICQTWISNVHTLQDDGTKLPPKIHVSSPKSIKDPRAHADYVDAVVVLEFLRGVAATTPRLDVMLEAKMKDAALIQLMEELSGMEDVKVIDAGSIEI